MEPATFFEQESVWTTSVTSANLVWVVYGYNIHIFLLWRIYQKLNAGMNVCHIYSRIMNWEIPSFGSQSYSHRESLIGLQDTHTHFGLCTRFKNSRNNRHVISTVRTQTMGKHIWITNKQTSHLTHYNLALVQIVNLRSRCHLSNMHPAEEDTQSPCLKPRTTHDWLNLVSASPALK